MDKIFTIDQAVEKRIELRNKGKRIVLVGGCFDILHVGHIIFLEKAKAAGDVLFVLLEADERIKKLKGENRPINNQKDRAKILSSLACVDAVIKLPSDITDQDYDDMISKLRPHVFAVTHRDPNRRHKERQAKIVDAEIIEVTDIISDQSTSRLVELLGNEL